MMKVLQVITSLYVGGAEKLIVDMVPRYQEQGIQVDVLLFNGADTPFKEQLRKKGVRIYELGRGNVYNPLYILKLLPFFRRYDIVHTHNTACQLFAALGSVLCSVVLVTTEHNTSNRRRDWWWYTWVDRWMYSRYQSIICISNKAKDNLCSYIRNSKNIRTIYNGIDYQYFQSAQGNLLKKEKVIITMVAGFRYTKDQDTLIRAFQYLPTDKYDLWLVGDGERREILKNLTIDLGIRNRVSFLGIRDDIPMILKSSDIIVMSSHFEGLSLSSIEGMAVGRPFVASDVDGLHEITKDAGLLFKQGDAKELADIILQLMADKSYYQQIADRCQRRAAEYDIRKTVDAYLDVYKNLV